MAASLAARGKDPANRGGVIVCRFFQQRAAIRVMRKAARTGAAAASAIRMAGMHVANPCRCRRRRLRSLALPSAFGHARRHHRV
ncbi:MAG: hypothetical protein KGL12_06690 [Rhodospirillales bacterium]|nr:hypothetical protein [Rhodospirillales bacterium]